MPDLQDAISLLEKGNAREAAILLEAMADEMPGYATARVLLARAYEGLGEWNGALGSWREALHIVPNSPVIRRGLERAARKAASRAPIDELPELPSMSVSTPVSGDVEVAEEEDADFGPVDVEPDASDDAFPNANVAPLDADLAPPDTEVGPAGAEATLPEIEPAAPTEPDAASPEVEAAPPEPEAEAEAAPPEPEAEAEAAPPENEPAAQQAEPDVQPAEPPAPSPDDEDLDRLIAELESARIVPRPDLDSLPDPQLEDDIEDVVSVTLARIYASQGQYDEAARVYELLAGQQPDHEQALKAKAAEMRSKASEG